jgi:hypothetical protein
MPPWDAEVHKVLVCQIADHREVNGVLGEELAELSKTDRCQPLGNASRGISIAASRLRVIHIPNLEELNGDNTLDQRAGYRGIGHALKCLTQKKARLLKPSGVSFVLSFAAKNW